MAENDPAVWDGVCTSKESVERLDEVIDTNKTNASDDLLDGEERIAENVDENPPVTPLAFFEAENMEEVFATPRQGIDDSAFRGFPQFWSAKHVQPERGTSEGELIPTLIFHDGIRAVEEGRSKTGDSDVVTNDRQEVNDDPNEGGLLTANSIDVAFGSPLHTKDMHRQVSGISLDSKFKDTEIREGDFLEHTVVTQENCEGEKDYELKPHEVNHHAQVSDVDICDSSGDDGDKKLEVPSLSHEDSPMETEKNNLPGFMESGVVDVENSQDGRVTIVLEELEEEEEDEEEEEEIRKLSTEEIIRQFLSPDESQADGEFEENYTKGILEIPRYDVEVISDYSSDGETTQYLLQSKSVELDNEDDLPSMNGKHSCRVTPMGSSAESSTIFPLSPICPRIESPAPSVEFDSHTEMTTKVNGNNTPMPNPISHESINSLKRVDSSSSKFVTVETSPITQLNQTEASIGIESDAKPTVTNDGKSGAKTVDGPQPPSRPVGLGSSASLLEQDERMGKHGKTWGTRPPTRPLIVEEAANGETWEENKTSEKLQMIRVKFLRLARRLGQTPHNPVVAQVLYRLGLAEQLRGSSAGSLSFDRASGLAEQLDAAADGELDFSCTIMVLGKTGVGKSATINSIFDDAMVTTDPFQMGTRKVEPVAGTVQGIKVKVIDTPGLMSSGVDQGKNQKILNSVKSFIKKTPPDIVLYFDRLDMKIRDYGDLPMLRTVTDIFGPAIWFNAIVVLSHAASAPPEGPNGTLTYDTFVAQRSHVVQQAIRQAAGDMRLMNPISLVENHSACRTNRDGQRVLPNGQVWKPHLLLLSFASKILAEANTLLKLQTNPPGKPIGSGSRAPPLPFLLSSLLQSRPQVRFPEDPFGDEDDSIDNDVDNSSDTDDENEYDELPPFRRLTKHQISKLNKEQRTAYIDELDYREKLFMRKKLREEKRRRKLMKRTGAWGRQNDEYMKEESGGGGGGGASVPVPMPDMTLPPSFHSDYPSYLYRYLDTAHQWLIRPVLEAHGWDHDVGYDGLNVERLFVVRDTIPVSLSAQVTKDKREANVQLECVSSIKHGGGKATSLSLDMQTLGKDVAYTLRGETRVGSHSCNMVGAGGLSVTILGEAIVAGVKVEDKLIVDRRLKVVVSGGAMAGHGDVAYGGTLEATVRDKDYPIGRMLSTLSLSLVDWHGDLALGCNLQSQIPIGRCTTMIARANLNNRGSGQVSIRLNTSEKIQVAVLGLLPLVRNIIRYPYSEVFFR